MRASRAALGCFLTLVLPGALLAPAQAEESPDGPGKMVLVLDSSGSMKESTGGGTRIDAARTALNQVVDELPDDAQVGIRVFGATVENKSLPGGCTDTQNVVPVGKLDRSALKKAVTDYKPYGDTPIGAALEGAAKDLGPAADGEPRTIVLLSDGEPNCKPDPCQVARKLTAQGINVKINVVGLNVNAKARQALQCIAKAGKGEYFDANNAAELAGGLVKVSVRDLRQFALTGKRIEGGTTLEQALPVEAGTYIDTALPNGEKRFYAIKKPKGGGVSVSAMARPPRGEEHWNSVLRIELTNPEGEMCVQAYDQAIQVLGFNAITSTGVQLNELSGAFSSDACKESDEVIATVLNEAGSTDYRLRVGTQPALKNATALPPKVDAVDGPWSRTLDIPRTATGSPIVGGVEFEDAPELTPGEFYSDSLRPGEELVYKVAVAYGQAVRMSARLATDRQAAELQGALGPFVELRAVSPLGQRLPRADDPDSDATGGEFYNGEKPVVVIANVPTIRATNAGANDGVLQASSSDGFAYFTLGMGADRETKNNQFAAPLVITTETMGEETGVPEYDGKVADADASSKAKASKKKAKDASDDSDGGSGILPWALGGGILAVLLAGGAYALGRRSGS